MRCIKCGVCAAIAIGIGVPQGFVSSSPMLQEGMLVQVAVMVNILDRDLKDRKKTVEVDITPLAGSSYHSLITAMLAKRLKTVLVSFYAESPKKLLASASHAAYEGWTFS